MAVTIASLRSDKATTEVPYGKHTISITYKPGLVTADALAAGRRDAEFLADVLTDWDVMKTAKTKLPVTAENIASLPIPLVTAMVKAVLTDGAESAGEAEGSFGAG